MSCSAVQVSLGMDSKTGQQLSQQSVSGAGFLLEGFRLLTRKGLRRYALVPVLINLLLFIVLSIVFYRLGTSWLATMASPIQPELAQDWLSGLWMSARVILLWLAWIIGGLLFFIAYGFSFNIITNILAAPFYGLLAEKTELYLAGTQAPEEPIAAMTIRVLWRELQKLWYFFSRGVLVFILLLILGFIPLVNFAVPVLGFLWAAWCLCVQYIDYPADNYRVPFAQLRQELKQIRVSALSFGSLLTLFAGLPLVNIFAFPAAVAGGTAMWVAHRDAHYNDAVGT